MYPRLSCAIITIVTNEKESITLKKLTTITLTALAALSLAACGNNNQQSKENSSLKAENSSLKAKSSSKTANASSQKAQTASSSSTADSSSQTTQLTVEQVADRFAQIKHLDRSQVNIYVHPTADPDIYRVYTKDKNSDPNIDSLADHSLFNVKTNEITPADSRD